ncbi:MAG: glycosyltransferase [Chloroflexi bacterium]|nr:glycosyltransferase [Chloroflexota bacterium]
MEILMISRCPPYPVHDGDRLIPGHLGRELNKKMHSVDLLAFYQRASDLADVPFYERSFNSVQLFREPRRSRLSYRQRVSRADARFPTRAEGSWSPEMWNAVQDILSTRTYDVIHLFGGVQVYEYRHLVRDIPNIIVPYESYSLWMDRAVDEEQNFLLRQGKKAMRRMARSFESWMFEGYDRVVVLADRDARTLRELNPETPAVVIPNGVDTEYFTPTGYESTEPTLVFTGNYDYGPNLDAALRLAHDIFPRIHQKVPQSRLYIIGKNPPPQLLACASDSIEVTGFVPDLRPYFEQSLIFISPLRLGAGLKNKVLEAMAMQCPVVATPLSCDGIPVRQGQHVLLGNSDDDLVNAVFRLFKDKQLRRDIAQNGRILIERHFTWQRVAEMYEDLYLQVMDERG